MIFFIRDTLVLSNFFGVNDFFSPFDQANDDMARDLEEAEEELERVKVRFRRKKMYHKKKENSFMRDFIRYFYFSLFFF